MHEFSLMNDLLKKILKIAEEQNARKIIRVKVNLGALSHISKNHFLEHFKEGIKGTIIESAEIVVEVKTDIKDPSAQDIILESVEVEV